MVGLSALVLCLLFVILQQKSLTVLAKRRVIAEHKLYQCLTQLRATNLNVDTHQSVFLIRNAAKSHISVMKELRAQTGMGLRDAKEALATLPCMVALDCEPQKAEEIRVAFAKLDAEAVII